MQALLAVHLAQDDEGLPLKGVAIPDDGHPLREVLVMGSVWQLPSTRSRTPI
jgi:hypothetical protein